MFVLGEFQNRDSSVYVLIRPQVFGALRAGPNASPPLNMRRSLIFLGVVVLSLSSLIFFLRGEQRRKAMDEQKLKESIEADQERDSTITL